MNTRLIDERQRREIERHYGPLGPYQVELTEGVVVPLGDGVDVTAMLALPAGAGPVPAVLMRSPYRPESFPPDLVAIFVGEVIAWASHGYACLLQSTRGTTSYFDEATDGAATVGWIEAQPWFDGRLGLTGASYHAFTSWATASTRPASLKAIATVAYSADRVSSWYPGGGFGLELALGWTAVQQAGGVAGNPYGHLPLAEADVAATGTTLDFYQERLAHDGDDPHWQPLNFTRLLDDPPAPILHLDGWYDYHRTYFWQDFERLVHNGHDVPFRLVVGPWSHAAPDARVVMAERLAWFDRYMRGDGGDRAPALRYYRTGADAQWRELPDWQEPPTVVLHAHADGLLLDAAAAPGRVEWTYDPADPTPSVGFLTINTGEVGGTWDNDSFERRPDVRVFTSTPFPSPMDLAGRVSAVATFSADTPSADLFLRVLDVYENGEVQNLADGILRVTDPALAAGVPVSIDLGPVGHRLAAGHRLRLLVAGGAHPYYNRNLGAGEPTATATKILVAHQAITVGGDNGLRVVLPLATTE